MPVAVQFPANGLGDELGAALLTPVHISKQVIVQGSRHARSEFPIFVLPV